MTKRLILFFLIFNSHVCFASNSLTLFSENSPRNSFYDPVMTHHSVISEVQENEFPSASSLRTVGEEAYFSGQRRHHPLDPVRTHPSGTDEVKENHISHFPLPKKGLAEIHFHEIEQEIIEMYSVFFHTQPAERLELATEENFIHSINGILSANRSLFINLTGTFFSLKTGNNDHDNTNTQTPPFLLNRKAKGMLAKILVAAEQDNLSILAHYLSRSLEI